MPIRKYVYTCIMYVLVHERKLWYTWIDATKMSRWARCCCCQLDGLAGLENGAVGVPCVFARLFSMSNIV